MSPEVRAGLLALALVGSMFAIVLAVFALVNPTRTPSVERSNCAQCLIACAREHMAVHDCSYRSTMYPFGPDCHCEAE